MTPIEERFQSLVDESSTRIESVCRKAFLQGLISYNEAITLIALIHVAKDLPLSSEFTGEIINEGGNAVFYGIPSLSRDLGC